MRIAQVAPLWERVPPMTYGGIELMVSLLTDELVRRGHDVTLFASGDSRTLARLESVYPRAIRLDNKVSEYDNYESLQLDQVLEQSDQFDIIHYHVGYAALNQASRVKTATVHTLHGHFTSDQATTDPKATATGHKRNSRSPKKQTFVSISNAQRTLRPNLNYLKTIYNGIDLDMHQFYPEPQDPPYLCFLGRMCEEKGTHLAIQIAQQSGYPLKIAGKIDDIYRDYYEEKVAPFVDGETIQFLGEVNHEEKNKLLGNAIATLFPITWHEPFGLVMTESMAAGTPVIAMRMGSTPEVIAHGKTGFLCDRLEDCVDALATIHQIDRHACRKHVDRYFSVHTMVDRYEAVYRRLVSPLSSIRSGESNHGFSKDDVPA